MAETATKAMMRRDNDMHAARQTADLITNLLRDFIPEHCMRAAWDRVAEASHQEGFELTSKLMRKEYEAWKETTIQIGLTSPLPVFSTKPVE